jgi:hypothetical protein
MLGALLLMATIITPPGQPKPMQPSDYTPAAQSQVVSWQLKRLAPPSPLYVTVDDVLRVSAATSQANEVVTVSWRLLRAADGVIVYGQGTVQPASNRSVAVQDFPLAEGFLLSVSCKAAVAATVGATFVRLFLNPKALGAGQPGFMLMSDYATTQISSGFPNGRITAPTEGPGGLTEVPVTSPAAGADWTLAIPTNALWRVMSIFSILVASGAAGNRVPMIRFNFAGGARFFRTGTTVPIIANANLAVVAGPGNAFVGDATNTLELSFPAGLKVRAGDAIASETAGLLAGDQYSAIAVRVEDYLENV